MVTSLVDCIQYLSWTYYFRRLLINPSYYGLEDTSPKGIEEHLIDVVKNVLVDLAESGVIECNEDFSEIHVTRIGQIASYYYLDYRTVGHFKTEVQEMGDQASMEDLIRLLSDAMEFSELPVRHNEDEMNVELSYSLPWSVDMETMDSSHTKTFLLLQAHFYRKPLPISDYINDTKSVLDQVPRVLNALIDITTEEDQYENVLTLMKISQLIVQGLHDEAKEVMQLPQVDEEVACRFEEICSIRSLKDLTCLSKGAVIELCRSVIPQGDISSLSRVINDLPQFKIQAKAWRNKEFICMQDFGGEIGHEWKPLHLTGDVKDHVPCSFAARCPFELQVSISKLHGSPMSKIYSPKFHKPKASSWWMVLGHINEDGTHRELLAVKRIGEIKVKSYGNSSSSFGTATYTIEFTVPDIPAGVQAETLSLSLISDAITGLDSSIEFKFETASDRKLKRIALKKSADDKFAATI